MEGTEDGHAYILKGMKDENSKNEVELYKDKTSNISHNQVSR